MDKKRPKQYALLSFKSRSIKCPENALIIAAKLVCRISPEARHNLVSCINMELLLLFLSQDSVSLGKACRLMFHGRIVKSFSNKALFDEFASQLKIYRYIAVSQVVLFTIFVFSDRNNAKVRSAEFKTRRRCSPKICL